DNGVVHAWGRPSFSPDAGWWWSGEEWFPAWSPDRRWRWTGTRWARARWLGPAPRWITICGAGWLVVFGAWLPGVDYLVHSGAGADVTVRAGLALGLVSLLSAVVYGSLL